MGIFTLRSQENVIQNPSEAQSTNRAYDESTVRKVLNIHNKNKMQLNLEKENPRERVLK